jgi:hypothetical protein
MSAIDDSAAGLPETGEPASGRRGCCQRLSPRCVKSMKRFAVDDGEGHERRGDVASRAAWRRGTRRMSEMGRRTTVPAALLFVGSLAVALGLSTPWSHPAPTATSGWAPVVAVPDFASASATEAPDASSLAAVADYVSPDGSYVRIGPVEISAIGPVGRPAPSL